MLVDEDDLCAMVGWILTKDSHMREQTSSFEKPKKCLSLSESQKGALRFHTLVERLAT